MGIAQPMSPRQCGQLGHGAFRFHGAAWILCLRARRRDMDGAQAPQGVRKTGLDARILDARCRFQKRTHSSGRWRAVA